MLLRIICMNHLLLRNDAKSLVVVVVDGSPLIIIIIIINFIKFCIQIKRFLYKRPKHPSCKFCGRQVCLSRSNWWFSGQKNCMDSGHM